MEKRGWKTIKKNWNTIQHIYLNWKRMSGGKVTQCNTNLPPAIYFVFLNKVFQFHQLGCFKPALSWLPFVHSSSDRNLQSVQRIHISLEMSRQQRQEVSSESSSTVLRVFFNFFIYALCFSIPLSCKWHACFLFFRPRSWFICSELSVVLRVRALLT